MIEDIDYKDNINKKEPREIASKRVRAGKRTYFFDLKVSSVNQSVFLAITESKRCTDVQTGNSFFEKRKIHINRLEDMVAFHKELGEMIDYIKSQEILEKSSKYADNDIDFDMDF